MGRRNIVNVHLGFSNENGVHLCVSIIHVYDMLGIAISTISYQFAKQIICYEFQFVVAIANVS